MTQAQILLEIAGIAAGAIGRHLAPKTKAAATKTIAAAKKAAPKKKPAEPFTMYDAVTVANLPAGAAAYAGYVNGLYANIPAIEARFRHRLRRPKIATITIRAQELRAEFLDVENGDATPEQAPGWVLAKLKRGDRRPGLYANRSTMPRLWALLAGAGIRRDQVRLWVADWTEEPHIPAGYDACQWHGGLHFGYDESLCLASFFS